MTIPSAAWSAVARDYAERIAPTLEPAARALAAYLDIHPSDRVVDVACGPGTAALAALDQGATQVVGIDFAADMIAVAREWAARHPRVVSGEASARFEVGDALAMPLADASVDVAISNFGMVFASDPERLVGELVRILAPGGRLGFTSWPPFGAVGEYYRRLERYITPPEGHNAHAWGDPAVARAWLQPRFDVLLEQELDVPLDAGSPEDAWLLLRASGRVANAYRQLDPLARIQLDHEMREFFSRFTDELEAVHWPREALVVCARKAA
jgi:SAM-dependent methyltransferase